MPDDTHPSSAPGAGDAAGGDLSHCTPIFLRGTLVELVARVMLGTTVGKRVQALVTRYLDPTSRRWTRPPRTEWRRCGSWRSRRTRRSRTRRRGRSPSD